MAGQPFPKYKRTTLVLSEATLQEVDRRRGDLSRSEYVDQVLDMFFRTEKEPS